VTTDIGAAAGVTESHATAVTTESHGRLVHYGGGPDALLLVDVALLVPDLGTFGGTCGTSRRRLGKHAGEVVARD